MKLVNQNPVTMWVPQTTRDTFKQIAQATGESQHEVAARLAQQEQKRLERKQKGNSRV